MAIEDALLRYGGLKTYSDMFNPPEDFIRKYNADSVTIGHSLRTNKECKLDVSEGYRAVLLGIVGSGKTFSMRSVAERMYLSGKYHVIFLSDVKNEFYSSNSPAPASQGNTFLRGEKPQGFPVFAIKPNYFKTYRCAIPEGQHGFSFKFTDLEESDWKDLLSFHDLPPVQMAIVAKLIKTIVENPDEFNTTDQIKEFVRNSEELDKHSRITLELKLSTILDSGFFGTNPFDIIELMQNDHMITLNLEFFERLGSKSLIVHSTLNIIRRMVVTARKEGRLKKRVLMLVDESSRWLDKNKKSYAKEDMLDSVELDRRYRVDLWFVYQTFEDIDPKIFANMKYLFLPNSTPMEVFITAMKSFGYTRGTTITLRPRIEPIIKKMRKEKYSWMLFSRSSPTYDILKFLSPLSKHVTSS